MLAILNLFATTSLVLGLTAPASAQPSSNEKNLTYEVAKVIAETAYETCMAQGFHVSVHVVGREGETRFAIRGDGSSADAFDNSRRKAYAMRMRPSSWLKAACPSGSEGRSSAAWG
jgi:uncharacterized protein GlcG (DUF336 family)